MKGWVLGMSRCYHLAVDLIICEKAPRANVPALAVFNVVNALTVYRLQGIPLPITVRPPPFITFTTSFDNTTTTMAIVNAYRRRRHP